MTVHNRDFIQFNRKCRAKEAASLRWRFTNITKNIDISLWNFYFAAMTWTIEQITRKPTPDMDGYWLNKVSRGGLGKIFTLVTNGSERALVVYDEQRNIISFGFKGKAASDRNLKTYGALSVEIEMDCRADLEERLAAAPAAHA